MANQIKEYTLWKEGFVIIFPHFTGNSAKARCLGTWKAKSFIDACHEWAVTESESNLFSVKDGVPYFWGCRIYDNESDARESFG